VLQSFRASINCRIDIFVFIDPVVDGCISLDPSPVDVNRNPAHELELGATGNCAVAWVHRQLSRTYSGTAGATMAPVRRPIKGRSEGWLTIREGREIGTSQSPQSVRSAQGARPTLLDGSGIPNESCSINGSYLKSNCRSSQIHVAGGEVKLRVKEPPSVQFVPGVYIRDSAHSHSV
jgi:hypothetical protein